MADEAQNLIVFPRPRAAAPPKASARRVVAVGGGKGGIGKSLVSANLGIALAQKGAKVTLVDADLGGANLHTCLGIDQPTVSMSDFIGRRVERLEDIQVPTGQPGLSLIAGAHDGLDAANPKHAQKSRLLRHVRALDVDYVILDLGAGTTLNVLDFFLSADIGLVVLLPEPTSIENAYRFIKAAFFRRMQELSDPGLSDAMALVLSGRDPNARTPWDLVTRLREHGNPAAATQLELSLSGFHPWLVVNQARTRGDHDMGPTVAAAWKKFFGLELGYLGAVAHDDSVWKAVRARQALLTAAPQSGAASGLLRVAENLLALDR
jgi:flagellar biosynthesis protein FlhG